MPPQTVDANSPSMTMAHQMLSTAQFLNLLDQRITQLLSRFGSTRRAGTAAGIATSAWLVHVFCEKRANATLGHLGIPSGIKGAPSCFWSRQLLFRCRIQRSYFLHLRRTRDGCEGKSHDGGFEMINRVSAAANMHAL